MSESSSSKGQWLGLGTWEAHALSDGAATTKLQLIVAVKGFESRAVRSEFLYQIPQRRGGKVESLPRKACFALGNCQPSRAGVS